MMRQLMFLALLCGTADVSRAEEECRLWLAPSHLSTDKNQVFGLFAGSQGFAEDEIIPSHDVAVPLLDF